MLPSATIRFVRIWYNYPCFLCCKCAAELWYDFFMLCECRSTETGPHCLSSLHSHIVCAGCLQQPANSAIVAPLSNSELGHKDNQVFWVLPPRSSHSFVRIWSSQVKYKLFDLCIKTCLWLEVISVSTYAWSSNGDLPPMRRTEPSSRRSLKSRSCGQQIPIEPGVVKIVILEVVSSVVNAKPKESEK